jgi:hypothetical protein
MQARSSECASQVSRTFPEKGGLGQNFNQTMFLGEQGRSRIPFRTGLSPGTENPAL